MGSQEEKQLLHEILLISDYIQKADLLNKTAWDIRSSNPAFALELASQALSISQEKNYKKGEGDSYANLGTACYLLSAYEQAIRELHRAIEIYTSIEDEKSLATAIRMQGNIYHSIDEDEKAVTNYVKALELCSKNNDQQGIAYNHGNIGYVRAKQHRYDEALENMYITLSIVKEMNDLLGWADVENNIGKCYFYLDQKEKAFNYFKNSLENSLKINHKRGIANAHLNIGKYFLEVKNIPESISNFQNALSAANEMGEKLLISEILKNLSEAFENSGDINSAFDYYKKHESVKGELLKSNYRNALNATQVQYQLEQSENEKEIYRLKNIELGNAYKQIEEKNIELERLSIVASKTDNTVIIADAEGKIEWINDAGIRINNLSPDRLIQLIGSYIGSSSTNHELSQIVEDCIQSKQTMVYETHTQNQDGVMQYLQTTLTPVIGENGEIRKLVFIDSNISRLKEAQEIIRQKNKDITDSINYARKIQDAILPSVNSIRNIFPDHFILYKPKDIVSGDFYWSSLSKDHFFIACADCTGHGVPGALMSVMCTNIMHQVINDKHISSASQALKEVDHRLRNILNLEAGENRTNDGMDLSLCSYALSTGELTFSGANRPLWIIRNDQCIEFPASKFSVGGRIYEKEFTEHSIYPEKGDMLYLFSDGYPDQFGGTSNKKFKSSNLKKLLISIQSKTMAEQKEILDNVFEEWKGLNEQTDDVCIIGIRF